MWMNRTLLLGPRVAVVTSQQAFRAALRRLNERSDRDPFCESGWHACVHAYEADGELACVVGLNMPALGKLESIDAAAVLVHEAVHIWQHLRDRFGPGDLGKEMEAYAVQNLAAGLMRAYVSACRSSAVAKPCAPAS